MFLLEHDAKELLARSGVPVPPGCRVSSVEQFRDMLPPSGALVVKGQIPAGGRGKAGLIAKAADRAEAVTHIQRMLGTARQGNVVNSVRVEQDVGPATEAYISFMLAPERAAVRVMVSSRGGVDIEQSARASGTLRSEVTRLQKGALKECVSRLTSEMSANIASALQEAGVRLAEVFVEREALLLEINPLFVRADGSWIAGDAKMVIDDNALVRQTDLQALLRARMADYPAVGLKFTHGFDYVVVDPLGEIGLITSGAGLCMMLLDELRATGLKPYNFLDMRAGGFHGKTTRLLHVLEWIRAGRNVKLVLVNIVAGGIDLGEFSRVLFAAFEESGFDLPFVIRFAGRKLGEAERLLSEKGIPMHTDLDRAILEVRERLRVLE